jgi:hypothetical protein
VNFVASQGTYQRIEKALFVKTAGDGIIVKMPRDTREFKIADTCIVAKK